MAETLTVRKELVERLLLDFDELLNHLEEEELSQEAEKRIDDLKSGKVKSLSEEEFIKQLKEDGINVSF